ncbi:cis-Golgi t-SNARE syntaxin [Rhizophlyctis rosea]|nr:cis-Golgi t-SNARE syntaxin [Rhizophlyctis rosea]
MTVKDRTQEFHAVIDSIVSRSGPTSTLPSEKLRLLHQNSSSSSTGAITTKSEFAKAAAQIGREINSTVTKLQKLTLLAKRKSLFDDRPVEINELIYIIKQDIAKINNQIAQLSAYLRKNGAAAALAPAGSTAPPSAAAKQNRQIQEHSTNVITSLQSKLAVTSNEFKNILEIRTQNMKDQKERRDQYSFAPQAGAGGGGGLLGIGGSSGGGLSDSPLYHPDRRNTPALTPEMGRGPTPFGTPQQPFTIPSSTTDPTPRPSQDGAVVIDFTSGSTSTIIPDPSQNQLQLTAPNQTLNMELIESRSQAIESIEATIAELGQIYQHVAQMVASQREQVQRIDENVMDVETNVIGAHGELMKYYQNISSNRWLMMKVFAVVVIFFLVFVLMT